MADLDDTKSNRSVGKKPSKVNVIPTDFTVPIMEVVTTVVGEDGKTSHIKGVSIAEEEVKSIKKSARIADFDGKSSKSFARSIRSRKMGGVSQAVLE